MADTFTQDDVNRLKDEEQTESIYESENHEVSSSRRDKRRERRQKDSSFGAFVLIGLGLFFLARNFGLPFTLHWSVLFGLWPFMLIFFGVTTLLKEWQTGIGRLLHMIWSLAGIAFFGYALVFGNVSGLFSQVGITPPTLEAFAVDMDLPQYAEQVEFELNLSSHETQLYALEDSNKLLDGTVYATEGVDLQLEGDESGHYTLDLDTENDFFGGIAGLAEGPVWELGLNPTVAYDLRVDMASGVSDLDLSQLILTNLHVGGASGTSQVRLPNGDYDVNIDVASGAMDLTIGEARHVEIDGGSGALTLNIPPNLDVRIHVDGGSGAFGMDHPAFEQVELHGGDSIWQTSDNVDMEINIDVGSGSVTVKSTDNGR